MSEHEEESVGSVMESVKDKITEVFNHGKDKDKDSSAVNSGTEKPASASSSTTTKDKIHRLFGREKPVYDILGGGKTADVFLWRNNKISGGVLGGATTVWVLVELLEYHLVTLVCQCLLAGLAILFVWSNATTFIKKSPPNIPDVHIPEDLAVNIALSLRFEINRAISVLRSIALGQDIKAFLVVIAGLWILSIIGSCCNLLTLSYIAFVLMHTVPVLYEKYDDKVDMYAEKAMQEIKKQFAVFDAKVLSNIPRGPLKDKKL